MALAEGQLIFRLVAILVLLVVLDEIFVVEVTVLVVRVPQALAAYFNWPLGPAGRMASPVRTMEDSDSEDATV